MILTVTPNPAVDITWHVDRFSPGDSHRVPRGALRAGGKGINVARVLHRTGHDVLALSTVGGLTGKQFRDDLDAAGIRHRLIRTTAPTRISAAVVDSHSGNTTILNEIGEALDHGEAALLCAAAVHLAASATAIAISGSLRPGFDAHNLGTLIRRLRPHARVIVDTSGPGIISAAQNGADVLKPNREELETATGHVEPLDGARELLGLGARLVVSSLGAEGLLIVPADGPAVRARLATPLHGNATGAGDAAVAAIAVSLAARDDLWSGGPVAHGARVTLARRATAWSAAAVLMPLAGEISETRDALESQVLIDTIPEEAE